MTLAREQGRATADDLPADGQDRRPRPPLRRRLARTGIPALAAAGGLAALAVTRAGTRQR
jgi:hypothetical protein